MLCQYVILKKQNFNVKVTVKKSIISALDKTPGNRYTKKAVSF